MRRVGKGAWCTRWHGAPASRALCPRRPNSQLRGPTAWAKAEARSCQRRNPSAAFAHPTALLEVRSNDLPRFLARDDGNDFKCCAVASPLQDPFLEEAHVVAAHELEATAKVGLHPTIDIFQAVRQRTPGVPQALIDRDHIVVAKSLDD